MLSELMMFGLLGKALLGAFAVVLIALFSKTKNFYLAGLVPFFPTFALIAHYIIGTERNMADLRQTALFGIASLVTYFAYLLCVYVFSNRLALIQALIISTLVWIACSSLLLLIWANVFSLQ